MKRVIVVGGRGFFGQALFEQLSEFGIKAVAASRSQGEIIVDVEDSDSMLQVFRRGDIVLDVAGPFQNRTARLAQAAIELGFDLVDMADCLAYVDSIYGLHDEARAAGIQIYTACSTVSSVSAAAIIHSGIAAPVAIRGLLVPATRHSAVAGTALSLFASIGKPIEVLSDGQRSISLGWQKRRRFSLPDPLGSRTGRLFECADPGTLPRRWSQLRSVEFYVDTNVFGLNTLFDLAARIPWLRRLIEINLRRGLGLSRFLGRSAGAVSYEIDGASGESIQVSMTATKNAYRMAILPAALAAQSLVDGRCPQELGVLMPDQHVAPERLIEKLEQIGYQITISPSQR